MGYPSSVILSITQPHNAQIQIHSVQLVCGQGWEQLATSTQDSKDAREAKPVLISEGDSVTELFHLRSTVQGSMSPGEVVVKWSRCKSSTNSAASDGHIMSSTSTADESINWRMALPHLHVEVPAILFSFKSAAEATIGIPFAWTVSLTNGTNVVQVSYSPISSLLVYMCHYALRESGWLLY